MKQNEEIPRLFDDALEYASVPDALEAAQRTFHERGLYRALGVLAKQWSLAAREPARLLDLCSATGLATRHVASEIPVSNATLVDLDMASLDRVADNLRGVCSHERVCASAISFRGRGLYDLILMNSAYHHIDPANKIAFLHAARQQLAPGGTILLGDHFLPGYSDEREFQQSVLQYYSALLADLELHEEPTEAIRVIRKAGLYCWTGAYEYKVSWRQFLFDVRQAGLEVLSRITVWAPPNQAPTDVTGAHACMLDAAMDQ